MSESTVVPQETADLHYPASPYHAIWWRAIFNPTPSAYEDLLKEPNASANTGIRWLFVSALAAAVITAVGTSTTVIMSALMSNQYVGNLLNTIVDNLQQERTASINSVPLIMLSLYVSHVGAQSLGGKGTYGKLVFLSSASSAPLGLLYAALTAIPFIGPDLLSILLVLPYTLFAGYLTVLAVKVVYNLSWIHAFIAGLIVPSMFAFAIACALALIVPIILAPVGLVLGGFN